MNGASLMDEIRKICNLGKCKMETGPCHRVSLVWWSFRRRWLLHKPGRRAYIGKEGDVWSCHKVIFLGRAGTKVCTKMRSWRLCSAVGRCEACGAEAPQGCRGCFPASRLAAGRGSTCSLSDREAVSLFPLIWTSCGA